MRTILLILVMIFLCLCDRKRIKEINNADTIIEIDLLSESGSTVKKLSDFATNIEYIPLQTVESSLMGGSIRKIIKKDKRIYISNAKNIMCFDTEGKFLFKLDNEGRGPGEYTVIFDFEISSDNKFLIIPNYSKLLIYGISDTGFTFERSLTLKDPVLYKARIVPETENVFLPIPPWRGTEQTLSLLINLFGDTIHFKPNIYKYKMVRRGAEGLDEMQVYSIGKMVCFKEEFSDTVFYVDAHNSSFKPRMILNSHGTIATPESRGGSETTKEVRSSVNNVFETSRYVFYLSYVRDNQNRILENRILFDKKTKTKYKLDIESGKSELKDDLSGGPDFNIDYFNFYCSGDKLFSFVEAITLKKYVAGEDFKNARVSDPKKKNEIKEIADSLNETDNPVLIVLTPKN
jgi:hypothetical protein